MQLQKIMKKGLLLFMAGTLLSSHRFSLPPSYAKKAESSAVEGEETAEDVPAISVKEVSIPVKEAIPEQLSVVNPEEGAVYIFKSSNKKIATVHKKTGILTGKKAGKAEVSLYKKGKKKNKLIGTCVVKVKKAAIPKKSQKLKVSERGTVTPVIKWKNSEAEYTYKSADKKIVSVDEVIDETTGATSIVITAKKEGKTTLTVKEKYKKKKTIVGKITVVVKKPSVATQNISMMKGQTLNISSVVTINHPDTSREVSYEYESADDEILLVDDGKMTAQKATTGIALTVYQEADGETMPLGTVTVVISEEKDTTPEAVGDEIYIDLSDYNNDYEDGFDNYDDNDYYPIGSDYVEDEMTDPDDSYEDYENYQDKTEHSW